MIPSIGVPCRVKKHRSAGSTIVVQKTEDEGLRFSHVLLLYVCRCSYSVSLSLYPSPRWHRFRLLLLEMCRERRSQVKRWRLGVLLVAVAALHDIVCVVKHALSPTDAKRKLYALFCGNKSWGCIPARPTRPIQSRWNIQLVKRNEGSASFCHMARKATTCQERKKII